MATLVTPLPGTMASSSPPWTGTMMSTQVGPVASHPCTGQGKEVKAEPLTPRPENGKIPGPSCPTPFPSPEGPLLCPLPTDPLRKAGSAWHLQKGEGKEVHKLHIRGPLWAKLDIVLGCALHHSLPEALGVTATCPHVTPWLTTLPHLLHACALGHAVQSLWARFHIWK